MFSLVAEYTLHLWESEVKLGKIGLQSARLTATCLATTHQSLTRAKQTL